MPSPRCTLLNLLVSLLLAARCIFKSDVYPQNAGGAVILGHPSISLSVCQLLSWGRKEVAVADHGPKPGLSRSHCFPSGWCSDTRARDTWPLMWLGGEELLAGSAPFEFLLWMLQTHYVINTSDRKTLLSVYFAMTWEGWVKRTVLKLRPQVKQYYYVLHRMFQNLLLKFESDSRLIHKDCAFSPGAFGPIWCSLSTVFIAINVTITMTWPNPLAKISRHTWHIWNTPFLCFCFQNTISFNNDVELDESSGVLLRPAKTFASLSI